MNVSAIITGHPTASGAAQSAYDFCQAALASGHKVTTVFLLHDAMLLGLNDSKLTRQWQQLCKEQGLIIHTCITAMQRRGIQESQLLPCFAAKGLSVLTDTLLADERVISFH